MKTQPIVPQDTNTNESDDEQPNAGETNLSLVKNPKPMKNINIFSNNKLKLLNLMFLSEKLCKFRNEAVKPPIRGNESQGIKP